MRHRLMNLTFAVLAVAGAAGIYSLATWAQNAASTSNTTTAAVKPENRPTPRTVDGHPDLNGFYAGGGGDRDAIESDSDVPGKNITHRTDDGSVFFDYSGANGGGFAHGGEPPAEPNQPPYKPEYMAKIKAEVDKYSYGTTSVLDPQQDCKPLGVPRGAVGIMQVVQTPKLVAILYEAAPGPYYRVIYTDGRKHPADYDTSYAGHSIGHWEGDTLVVDVVGLNDETWLGGGFGGPRYGNIHSDKEHVVERWTRKGDQLTYEATVEDPVMFTRPWAITPRRVQIAKGDDYIQPQMCVNNDKPHYIQPTEADHYQCDWCQKNADAVYGQGASADDKARAEELDKEFGEILRSAPGNEGLRRAAPEK